MTLALTILGVGKIVSADSDRFPAFGRQLETISGKLEIIIECEQEKSQILYYVSTDKGRVQLDFQEEPAGDLRTGMQVSVRGEQRGSKLIVTDSTLPLSAASAAESIVTNTFGEQKVLVLLVNFQNDTRQPFTVAQANDLVFNQNNPTSVANYYREASYQQTWLTGNTFGYFTLPINSGDCAGYTTAAAARQAATNAGINLAAYNRFVYVYPNMSACSYNGIAEIAGDEAWINGSMYLRTVTHEMGHTFGLFHARSLDCGDQVVGGTCTTSEYGHVADAMGYTGVTGQFHAFQKERLGWMNYGGSPAITSVQSSGDYAITANSAQDLGIKALKIQRSSGDYYYVELRRLVGFDTTLSPALTNGVVITLDQPAAPRENYQLDMTPETTFWTDSALPVGRSYTDAAAGFTITPVSVDSNRAVVNVTFGTPPPTCIMAAPSVAISAPTNQWVAQGSTTSYTLQITNNNTSGCSSNTFGLQAAVPSGWTWTTATPTLLVLPGAVSTASIQVTVPLGAVGGNYPINLGAVNVANSGFAAQVSAGATVFSSLGISVTSNQASYTSTQTATLTANVTANGTGVSGVSVSFVVTKPDGSTGAVGTGISGSNGVAVFTYKFNRKRDPIGTFRATASAALNGVSGNGATTFVLAR